MIGLYVMHYTGKAKGMSTFGDPRTDTIFIQTNGTRNIGWSRWHSFIATLKICILCDRCKAFHNPYRFPRYRAIRSLERIVAVRTSIYICTIIIMAAIHFL